MTDPVDPDELEEQRDALARLRELEAQVARLKADLVPLEVECLTAEAAVTAGQTNAPLDIKPAAAAEVVDLMESLGSTAALDRGRSDAQTFDPVPPAEERSRYEVGVRALGDWLDAMKPTTEAPSKAQVVVRMIMLALVVVVIWAAVKVHLALLILLPPLIVPYSMLMNTRDDGRWRRAGAKRHFDGTRLEAPRGWEEEAVRIRLAELEQVLARMREAAGERARPRGEWAQDPSVPGAVPAGRSPEESAHAGAESISRVDAEQRLAELVAVHRLSMTAAHELAPGEEAWLRKIASAYRARQALERLREAHQVAQTDAGEARESIFRFLARRGAAPSGGDASVDALEACLESLSTG